VPDKREFGQPPVLQTARLRIPDVDDEVQLVVSIAGYELEISPSEIVGWRRWISS